MELVPRRLVLRASGPAFAKIGTRQLGRRNLADDQRSIIANEVREWKSTIAQAEQRKLAAQQPRKANKPSGEVKSASPLKERTRASIAKETKLPERKIRQAQEIKKVDPKLSEMVRADKLFFSHPTPWQADGWNQILLRLFGRRWVPHYSITRLDTHIRPPLCALLESHSRHRLVLRALGPPGKKLFSQMEFKWVLGEIVSAGGSCRGPLRTRQRGDPISH
jgi:hypothetical protein